MDKRKHEDGNLPESKRSTLDMESDDEEEDDLRRYLEEVELVMCSDDIEEEDLRRYIADQDGFGPGFTVELKSEKHIPKFNVHGFHYTVKVDAIQRNISYDEAVQVLYSTMRGMF